MIAVVPVSAAVAGVLALGVGSLIKRLPDPVDDPPEIPYVEIARSRWTEPVAVVLSAAAAAVVAYALGSSWLLVGLVPLMPLLALLAIVDWRVRLLPKVVVLGATVGVLVLLVVEWALLGHAFWPLGRAVVGALLARGIFWLLWRVRQTGMGYGDVRLAGLVGMVLGRFGWLEWVVGLYAGLVLFGVWAVVRALAKRSREAMREQLAYGPFMILGMLVAICSFQTA